MSGSHHSSGSRQSSEYGGNFATFLLPSEEFTGRRSIKCFVESLLKHVSKLGLDTMTRDLKWL